MAPRHILPYLLSPGITFLALMLEDPTQVQARVNLKMLELLVQFADSLVDKEGLDLQDVLRGFTAMREVGRGAVNGDSRLSIEAASPTHHRIHTLVGSYSEHS